MAVAPSQNANLRPPTVSDQKSEAAAAGSIIRPDCHQRPERLEPGDEVEYDEHQETAGE